MPSANPMKAAEIHSISCLPRRKVHRGHRPRCNSLTITQRHVGEHLVQPNTSTNLAFRVATILQQLGIEGLPRNYELVFEAMTGNAPDLAREIKSLGAIKT